MDRFRKVTANAAGTVARWSAHSGSHEPKCEPTPPAEQRPCEYGSDGRWRATKSKSDIHSMACSTGRPAVLFTGSTNVRMWSTDEGVNTHVVHTHHHFSSVSCMTVAPAMHRPEDTPTGTMASPETLWCGHTDGSVMSIDVGGLHECRACFAAHRTAVTALAVVDCERELWTGSDSGTIRAWPDLGRHEEHSVELELPAQVGSAGSPEVKAMIYLHSSQTVWSAGHSGIHVWNTRTHAHKAALPDSARVTCLSVAEVGMAGGSTLVMSGHADGRIVLWNVSADGSGQFCRELFPAGWDASTGRNGSDHRVTALCACSLPPLPELSIPADTALWAGFADGSMHTYLGSTGELLSVINAHNSAIVSLVHFLPPGDGRDAASAGSRVVSSSKKGTLRVWGGDGLMWKERRQLAWSAALRSHCMSESTYDVAVATWNVNAKDHTLDGATGIASWLAWRSAGGSAPPALYAIGFQEVVPLNAAEMISVSTEQAAAWRMIVGQALADSEGGRIYTCIGSQQLVGILLLLFARDDVVHHISDISTSVVKTGIGGMGGNKGGVGIRLKLFETPVVFCCAHLAAHQDGQDERDAHYHDIAHNMTFSRVSTDDVLLGRGQADRISNHVMAAASADGSSPVIFSASMHSHFGDVGLLDASHSLVFWLGDLNYRINLTRSEALTLIRQIASSSDGSSGSATTGAAARERAFAQDRAMEQLKAHDQLFASRRRSSAFVEFDEPPVNFKPTYKFDPGTLDTYDSSEKQRIPAWCDRVLYRREDKGGAKVRVNGYRSAESLICSDHKPVVASFTVQVQHCENSEAATQLRHQFEAVLPRKAGSASFPISAVAASPRPRPEETGGSNSFVGSTLTGAAAERVEPEAAQPTVQPHYAAPSYVKIKQQMVSFGLQGVGTVQWGGKGAWKSTHVQLTGSTLRLRATGFAADGGPDGLMVINLHGTDARRPTTVRKGHPHAFRVNLSGADRLKYGVTKILCDLNDEFAIDQWIASLNQAANLDAAATAADATLATNDNHGSSIDSINGGLDEDGALRAAIAMSFTGSGASISMPHSGGSGDGGGDDEEGPALLRRRDKMQAEKHHHQHMPAPPASLDIFGATPFSVPTPEPEPGTASAPAQQNVQMDLHEFFGTETAAVTATDNEPAATDVFGMAPFDAAVSAPTSGTLPTAPAGEGVDQDIFGSMPFAGNYAGPAPAPAAKIETTDDLLEGW